MNKFLGVLFACLFLLGCGQKVVRDFESFKEIKEKNIVMQGFDYSCGAGALATLFTYYFNDPVSEIELLKDILEHIPKEVIENKKKEGLSLLDLKEAAQRRGYDAFGLKMKNSSLLKLDCPVLVYLETKDYRHFAVLKGVVEDRVFLADSSRGNIRIPIYRFLEEWKGKIGFVLYKEGFYSEENLLGIGERILLRPELEAVRVFGRRWCL